MLPSSPSPKQEQEAAELHFCDQETNQDIPMYATTTANTTTTTTTTTGDRLILQIPSIIIVSDGSRDLPYGPRTVIYLLGIKWKDIGWL
jgi:hypothetical protein